MTEDAHKVGRYRLLQLIATGGMGEVFLARSEGPAGFAKTVVIKRILRHLAAEEQFVEMFLNEARVAADLSHPNIVQIFELGEDAGSYFIAMEYIHGRSLRAVKQKLLEKRQVFSPVLASRLCAQALQGLHYAHTLADEAGQPLRLVHRDISPDNLLVGFNGVVKVVDFGIAKAANAITTTRTGTVKGKYAYMAPEQLTGGAIDARTDVYAMGVLLYELLTGARPYTAATEPALIHVILSTRPAPPRDRNPSLPAEINDLILKALEKDPNARFVSAEEMGAELEALVAASGHALTPAQVGAFLKDLFGAEAASPPAVGSMSARSGSNPSARSSRAGTVPGVTAAAPPEVAGAAPVAPTEVQATPISTGSRRKVAAVATSALPPGAQVSGLNDAPAPPSKSGSAPAAAGLRRFAIPGTVAAVALIVAGAAFVLGRGTVATSEAAPGDIQPLAARPPGGPAAAPPQVPSAMVKPPPPPERPAAPVAVAPVVAPPPAAAAAAVAVAEPATPEPAVAPAVVAEVPVRKPARTSARPRPPPAPVTAAGPGKVALRVSPWAEVFHDGKSLGITPLPPVSVPSGKQTFTLKNKDLNVSRRVTVTVPAGGEVTLRADLFE